jgi:hypothetical protein
VIVCWRRSVGEVTAFTTGVLTPHDVGVGVGVEDTRVNGKLTNSVCPLGVHGPWQFCA